MVESNDIAVKEEKKKNIDNETWSLSNAINLAAAVIPPSLENLENDVNVHLFSVNESGHMVILGVDGRLSLIQMYSSNPRHVDLACEPPITAVEAKKIQAMSFNRTGDRMVLRGKCFLCVINLPLVGPNLELQPESYDPSRFLVRFKNDTVKAITLSSKGSRLSLDEAHRELKTRKVENVKSITQEIYLAKKQQVGYFSDHRDIQVLDASWHPLSDHHLVVLSNSDNLLIYDCDARIDEPEQRHEISYFSSHPVSFTFGSDRGWEKFTCYILLQNASIVCACPLIPYGCRVKTSDIAYLKELLKAEIEISKTDPEIVASFSELKAQQYWLTEVWIPYDRTKTEKSVSSAPKSSKFSAPDDDSDEDDIEVSTKCIPQYQTTFMISLGPNISGISDTTWPLRIQGPFAISPKSSTSNDEKVKALSIISVSPFPSKDSIDSIPVLGRIFSNGILEWIALDSPIRPSWKNNGSPKSSDLVGLLLESLSMGIDDSCGAPVLKRDPSSPDLIYCSHSTGVHVIRLTWLHQLSTKRTLDNIQSCARHVFSVSPSMGKFGGVIGAEVLENVIFGNILLVRLASGQFEAINMSLNKALMNQSSSFTPIVENMQPDDELTPFEEIVSQLRNRGISGYTKVTGSTVLRDIEEETLQFVIDKVKEFHDIDIPYIREMNQITRDRFKLHLELIDSQKKEIASLRIALECIIENSKKTKERYQKIQTIQKNLTERAAAIVQAVSENQPVVSKEEKKYHAELVQLEAKLRRLKPKTVEMSLRASKLLRNYLEKEVTLPVSKDIPSDAKKMCYDVLTAEKVLLEDTKKVLEGVTSKMSSLGISFFN